MTGCGATTLAIEQEGNTIIAMPFVGLIENKVAQIPGKLLGIYGTGDKTEQVKEYVGKHPVLKIATTYDSLPKVCRILDDLGIPYRENTHLVVDEWHILFQAYHYRNNAVKNLLSAASRFSKVTYVSATPIERKYWLKELSGMDEVTVE